MMNLLDLRANHCPSLDPILVSFEKLCQLLTPNFSATVTLVIFLSPELVGFCLPFRAQIN